MKKIFFIFISSFLVYSIINGCESIDKKTLEVYKNSDLIFIGKLIKKDEGGKVFKILKKLKGNYSKKKITLKDAENTIDCLGSHNARDNKRKIWLIASSYRDNYTDLFINSDKVFYDLKDAENFFWNNYYIHDKSIKKNNNQKKNIKINGPTKSPPSKEEIDKLKCERDPEYMDTDFCKKKGILERIWEWFMGLFN